MNATDTAPGPQDISCKTTKIIFMNVLKTSRWLLTRRQFNLLFQGSDSLTGFILYIQNFTEIFGEVLMTVWYSHCVADKREHIPISENQPPHCNNK